MNISDTLGQGDIYLDVPLENKREALRFLAERACEKAGGGAEACRAALAAREKLGSTGVGNGVAIPHAQLEGLRQAQAIFLRPEHPINFGAADEEPVDLILMLLTPVGSAADHLEALSRFAKVLRSQESMRRLRSARSADQVLEALTS